MSELEQTISIVELNEWFVFWGLEKWEQKIKDKEMTDEDRSQLIMSGFGFGSS